MCLAIPSKIIDIKDQMGVIDVAGVRRETSLMLIEDPRIGDWVIVHAGFAIKKIDDATAQESLRYLKEAAQLLVEEGDPRAAAND
jgi:hydrogenase expression/formation protein HypC